MRAVRRVPLAPELVVRLQGLITEVEAEPTAASRKKCAKKVWGRKPRPLGIGDSISDALIESNFGQDRCMFCESNETAGIDHFVPKALEPRRVAAWDNLILACARCNGSGGKGYGSPFVAGTTDLAILDPTGSTADPADHLDYSARGDLTSETRIGRETILRLKLSDRARRPYLVKQREREWRHHNRDLLDLVGAHVAGNAVDEAHARDRLCDGPFPGLLIYLLRHVDEPGADVIFQPATLAALRAHPQLVAELLTRLRPTEWP